MQRWFSLRLVKLDHSWCILSSAPGISWAQLIELNDSQHIETAFKTHLDHLGWDSVKTIFLEYFFKRWCNVATFFEEACKVQRWFALRLINLGYSWSNLTNAVPLSWAQLRNSEFKAFIKKHCDHLSSRNWVKIRPLKNVDFPVVDVFLIEMFYCWLSVNNKFSPIYTPRFSKQHILDYTHFQSEKNRS